ncbi:MAG: cytochrome c biogenesis protein ResB [Desulfocapsaceae bacterium]|nr:cytochrome c biogenesis protein ResB [Desulfocapsaceae bacterium]
MTTKPSSVNVFSLLWDFFASVKLALLTLGVLCLASIVGTIIPQGEAFSWYVRKFGPWQAQLFNLFQLSDLFGSLWFKALLGILSCNLIICSLDRFPQIWKKITADNLDTTVVRLQSIKRNSRWTSSLPPARTVEEIARLLGRNGWKTSSRELDNGTLLFSQRGAWTRLGFFVVHASILIILTGAIIGSLLGFKGTALIPEGRSVSEIRTTGKSSSVDLGFEVRCDTFGIEYYQNGMPKEYRSDLTLLEQGREVLHKSIMVNHPLTYKGITFYQSSFEAYRDFIITLTDKESGDRQIFVTPYQKQRTWEEKALRFGVINAEVSEDRISRMKIWITGPDDAPSVFWMDPGQTIPLTLHGRPYLISAKQMYATGLQVAKDPGVWWVYIGCTLILAGLFTTFFLSHRKIWIYVHQEKQATAILMAGSTNKNKAGFDGHFSRLTELLKAAV